MVRTYANFMWDLDIPEDEEPPYAAVEVEEFRERLRVAGLDLSPPEYAQYCWDFTCQLPHIWLACSLGRIDHCEWLFACDPSRRLASWLHWGRWDDEQEHFVSVVDSVLRTDTRVTNLRWYTRQEWRTPKPHVKQDKGNFPFDVR